MTNRPDRPAPHYVRNFVAFVADALFFGAAFAFISYTSVLPALVRRLTGSAAVVGLIGVAFRGGSLLPQAAVGRFLDRKARKKPYLLAGLTGRVFVWVIAIALWSGLAQAPGAMLALFFGCVGLFAVIDGLCVVSMFDIMARAVPERRRGRLMGVQEVARGLAGIGAGIAVREVLDRLPFPNDYALLFALAGTSLLLSAAALALVWEPLAPERQAHSDRERPRSWVTVLAQDRDFRLLIICQTLVGAMNLSFPFYPGHAQEVLGLRETVIGDFVVAQTVASVVASALLGLAAERWGPRHAARIGSAVATLGPPLALIVHLSPAEPLVGLYPLVYVAVGVGISVQILGFFNYLLAIAPGRIRPTYIGLGNTVMGVLQFAPIAGGWLLEATSYTALFSLTSAIMVLGFLLSLQLEPTRAAAARTALSHQEV